MRASFWILWCAGLTASISSIVSAREQPQIVRVGTIIHNPPYVFEKPSTGIDVDTIRAAFQAVGISVDFIHAHLTRLGVLLELGRIDAMTAYSTRPDQCTQSDTFGYWHNGIVVRRDLERQVRSFADLAGLEVGMFPQAKVVFDSFLGPYWGTFGGETIIHTTPPVLRMLEYGRIDAYIGDSWGLDYLFARQASEGQLPPYKVAIEFEPTPRQLCFTDDALRMSFNRGLKDIQSKGISSTILARYRDVQP